MQKLHEWYQQHGRHDLPWRQTNDPYKIWISEIMLQQTQVKTVLERYYFPFLERFPTLQDLAHASIDDVLKAWEGLGYYTRARNLHRCAQICQTKLPKSAAELEKLPGIGRSTAHAIACFAYREPLPILDANVKRILHRYFALPSVTPKKLWDCSYQLFDPHNAYDFNQAMMDIGATICNHKNPQCALCPFEDDCQGKEEPLRYPIKKAKKKKPIKTPYILVYQSGNRFALAKSDKRLLGGLWGFEQSDVKPPNTQSIGNISHHYSHFGIKAEVYIITLEDDATKLWFSLEEIEKIALSGIDKKVLQLLV
jgi:A/G-specific adenine glycosylase